MPKFQIIKKIFIGTISWTLCFAPIAQETPSTTTTTSDPNYCYSDPASSAKKSSCEGSGLELNCHLNVCAKKEDNKIYNKEYSDCQALPTGQREACQNNLKSVGSEIAQNNENMNSSTGKGGNLGTIVTVGATVGLGCAVFTGSCPTDFGYMLIGAVGLALAFMTMQSGKLQKQLDEAKKQLKSDDNKDVKNWSAMTQVATLNQQIAAIEMIIKAAKEKAKKHQTVAALAGVIGTAALLCATATITGCTAGNPCAYFAAGAGFVIMAMELMAAKESNEVAKKWEENKETAVKLKNKIESLYEIDNPNNANQAGISLASNANGAQGQSIDLSAQQNIEAQAETNDESKKQCVDSNNEPSSCPCSGNSCQKITFQIPQTGIGAQVASLINFKEFENGANEAFNGDSRKLESLATPQNLATIQGIKNKLLRHVLDKDLIKGKDRALAQALLEPAKNPKVISDYIANNSSPLRSAALAHRFGLSNYKTDNLIAVLGEASKVPKFEDTAFKNKMKNIEAGIEFADLNSTNTKASLVNTKNSNLGENSDVLLGGQINPEKQMDIFKIISNRYNIMRVKKRIGN